MDVEKFMEIGQPLAPPPDDLNFKEESDWKETDPKKVILVKEARRMVDLLLLAVEKDEKTDGPTKSGLTFSKNSLKAFAASDTISVEKFLHSGGLRSISIVIKRYCDCSDAVHYACSALAALTLYERSTVKELVKVGTIDSVIAAVDALAQGGTEDAKVSALKVLRNLTQSEENRKDIWQASGLEAICKMIRHESACERTLSHAALVLSNLTFGNVEMKDTVGKLRGLEAIAKGMRDYKDHQAMQARGSLALRNLCFQSEYNLNIAGQAGVAQALVMAIDTYMDDREVVHQSCIALANLSNESEENRQNIVQAGGGATLVRLMKTYPDSLSANDDAISVLRNIAVGNRETQMEIGLNGGVGCVSHALGKFVKHEKIADKACTALRYLCFLEGNRLKVKDCGGIEAIVMALKVHVTNAVTVKNALLAIGNVTFESEENKGIVGQCGGIEAIIHAVDVHIRLQEIQEHGCRVLRNLSDGFEFNRVLQAESGAITTGAFAMMGGPLNASVQEQAAAMLVNLSLIGEAVIEKMKVLNVEQMSEKALRLHPKHRGVQLQAGSLLDRIHGYDIGVAGVAAGTPSEQESGGGGKKGLMSRLLPGRGGRK